LAGGFGLASNLILLLSDFPTAFPLRAFDSPRRFTQAAIDTLPPCRYVFTGEQAGPLWLLALNQNAVSHSPDSKTAGHRRFRQRILQSLRCS
jgi:hypothetical protein